MKKVFVFLFMIFAWYNVKAYDFANDPASYKFICVYASDDRGIGAHIYRHDYKGDNITRFRITGGTTQIWTAPSGLNDIENDQQCPDDLYYIYHQTSKEYFYSFNEPADLSYDNGYKKGKLGILERCWYDDEDGWDCENITPEFSSGDYYSSPNVDKYGNDDGEITSPGSDKTPNYNSGIFGYCDENGCKGTATCRSIFGKADDPNSIFGFMRKYIFIPIRWLTPIILIVLTSLDFAKAIFVDEKEGMGKAKSNFGKRAVVALIIFLAPTIVSILLTLVDGANISNCLNASDIGNL